VICIDVFIPITVICIDVFIPITVICIDVIIPITVIDMPYVFVGYPCTHILFHCNVLVSRSRITRRMPELALVFISLLMFLFATVGQVRAVLLQFVKQVITCFLRIAM
jgi:hypothetical protein